MKKEEFKQWLIDGEYSPKAVSSRVANIATIEKYYGDIDNYIRKGDSRALIEELTYSTDDERNRRPQRHKIPIDGNIRTGSATLKQAFQLYLLFYNSQTDAEFVDSLSLKTRVKQALCQLRESIPTKDSYTNQEVKEFIQIPLIHILHTEIPDHNWQMEYNIDESKGDRIDIVGLPTDDSQRTVIIEIDTHRSDQITKKFVSRSALTIDKDILYVSLLYGNNHTMREAERKEADKYVQYCEIITDALSEGTGTYKEFLAEYL